jgi:hypothetical protein
LTARYGKNCHYCKTDGHWYNNCQAYWDNVRNRIIDVLPRNFDQPQSNYLPLNRPQPQACIRQIDIPKFHNGKILINSGASTHVSGSIDMFISTEELNSPRKIALAITDYTVNVRFKGTILVKTNKGTLTIDDVYYVPGVNGVILKVGRLIDVGWKISFENNIARLISPNSIVFNTIYRNYCWFLKISNLLLKLNKITHHPSFDPYLWHRRLGHASETVVRKYLNEHYPAKVSGQEWELFFCEQCAISKAVNQKAPGSNSLLLQDNPLDMLVTDVAGPFPMDLRGCQYILTLRDHASMFRWCDMLPTQEDVPAKILSRVEHIDNTLGRYPKQIWSNNAPEYTATLQKLLKPTGILLAPVTPYSPKKRQG